MGALALASSLAFAATPHTASAQRVTRNVYQTHGAVQAAAPNKPAATQVEELPPGTTSQHPAPGRYGDPFVDEPGPHAYFPHDGYSDGGYSDGCYDGHDYCQCAPPGSSGCNSCGGGSPCGVFFIADYLYVRASFSEAVAFVEQTDTQQQGVNQSAFNVSQLDFQYDSSYRLGGGLTIGECCNQQLRFLYTRFTSDASVDVPQNDVVIPFELVIPPGGRAFVTGDVDVRSYDLDCAKTILLGGEQCCQCGDACADPCGGQVGCGDCCAPRCPAWDLTWSGGIRVADAEWARSYTTLDQADVLDRNHTAIMDFDGVGAKIGLEGRRYFFDNGSLSIYLKGDLSVLGGQFELHDIRTDEGGTAPDTVNIQSIYCRHIIPVTELEAGLSGQVTCNSRLTAGYLLSAWHDLGYRDEFGGTGLDPDFPIRYDDANILGFDGFFARFEWNY
jgi:hypothetical protein